MKLSTLKCSFSKHIYLVYDCNEERYIKFLNDNYDVEKDKTGALGKTFCNGDNPLKIYIWINEKQKVAEIIKTIYHEVYHTIVFLFKDRGISLEDSNGEVVAYLQEDLLEQILGFLSKKHK